jgi:hypothetical protein
MTDTTNVLMQALELDRNGDWDGAHRIVQQIESTAAYSIHAYLHRKEGDLSNAQYWYRRAGKALPEYGLDQEWQTLLTLATTPGEGGEQPPS